MRVNRTDRLEEQDNERIVSSFMDEYSERLGDALWEDYQRAKQAGEVPTPSPELDAECLKMIFEATSNKERKTVRPHRFYRIAAIAAVLLVVLLGTVITAQASGINVFGRLVEWTDEVLSIATGKDGVLQLKETQYAENELQEALCEMDMPMELAPTWLPNGYELASIHKNNSFEHHEITAEYSDNRSGTLLKIIVRRESASTNGNATTTEYDESYIESRTTNGRTYLISTNKGLYFAYCLDDDYSIRIYNVQTQDDLYAILSSIKEVSP